MITDSIAFLEENGFIVSDRLYLRKDIYNQFAKKVEIHGYLKFIQDYQHDDFSFSIDCYSEEKDRYGDSLWICSIYFTGDDHAEIALKKIITAINEIVTISYKTMRSYEQPIEFRNFFTGNAFIFSSSEGISLDLRGDELLIANHE